MPWDLLFLPFPVVWNISPTMSHWFRQVLFFLLSKYFLLNPNDHSVKITADQVSHPYLCSRKGTKVSEQQQQKKVTKSQKPHILQ